MPVEAKRALHGKGVQGVLPKRNRLGHEVILDLVDERGVVAVGPARAVLLDVLGVDAQLGAY